MTSEQPHDCAPKPEINSEQRTTKKHNSDLNKQNEHAKNEALVRPTTLNPPKKRGDGGNSPSKSKNKKKNDSKKRNSASKKGQNQNVNLTNQSEKNKEGLKSPTSPLSTQSAQQFVTDQKQIDSKVDEDLTKPVESVPCDGNSNLGNKSSNHKRQADINKEKARECKQLKEQLQAQNIQIQKLVEQVIQQKTKTRELDTALLSTTRTCNQLEKLLQQELESRSRLEAENESLEASIIRLKAQISTHEKNKSDTDELMRVMNATLMERETEVSILKLKLTRLQTNPSCIAGLNSASSISSIKQDPCYAYSSGGRSNSEFNRSSYNRSTLIADTAQARGSTSQLRSTDKDASVWATVPEELTPSKRPQVLEKTYQSIYADSSYSPYSNIHPLVETNQMSTPISRDRRYKTLPRSMKSPSQEFSSNHKNDVPANDNRNDSEIETHCKITNLDDSNSTSQSNASNTAPSLSNELSQPNQNIQALVKQEKTNSQNANLVKESNKALEPDQDSHYSTIGKTDISSNIVPVTKEKTPPSLPCRTHTTPVKTSSGFMKIFDKFRRSDSSASNSRSKTDLTVTPMATPEPSPFKRSANRSTMVGAPKDIRSQMSPVRQPVNFQTDKPFAEWDTNMLVDWLTMIGLSMYTTQCRRWVKCGAHIMNATPAEVDKGLGITNHLHRKKLRLAISELNGDCDKITKAASKLDYLWVARWLDDMGLPQYKEAFINARVDGRVLNYLTVEDLVSMGVKSLLHHASIRCGIKVLRSIKFDLQLLKRRATSDEIEQMTSMRQQMNLGTNEITGNSTGQTIDSRSNSETDIALWTCHRVMEWLRLIDFAEFAPNLRGSGVHGGMIVFEDGFNIDTMCSLLSIPISRTLLRRHLATFFKELIGPDLVHRKRQYQDLSSNQQLNPLAEIKTPKKSQWFLKLKSSKVGQDGLDEYLCPMYPMEPELIKNQDPCRSETSQRRDEKKLERIPESINV